MVEYKIEYKKWDRRLKNTRVTNYFTFFFFKTVAVISEKMILIVNLYECGVSGPLPFLALHLSPTPSGLSSLGSQARKVLLQRGGICPTSPKYPHTHALYALGVSYYWWRSWQPTMKISKNLSYQQFVK